MQRTSLFAALLLVAAFSTSSTTATEAAPQQLSAEEKLVALASENALLRERLRTLESTPALSSEALTAKSLLRLREVAHNARAQRQAMGGFEGFVTWMTGNLSGYAKYVEAGSVAAGFARLLPIPYAGQASLLTKFVSQGILALNATSVAINRYLATSQQFVARVEALPFAGAVPQTEISALARYADSQLYADMVDAQQKLRTTSDISSSALSFLESVHSYVGGTDEYWNKTKSLLASTEIDKKEKISFRPASRTCRKVQVPSIAG